MAPNTAPTVVPVDDEFELVETEAGWSLRKKVIVGVAAAVAVGTTVVVLKKVLTSPGKPSGMRGYWGTAETQDKVQALRNVHDVANASESVEHNTDELRAAVRRGDEKAIAQWVERFKAESDLQAGNLHRYTEYGDRHQKSYMDALEIAAKYHPDLINNPPKSVEAIAGRFTQEQAANLEKALIEANADKALMQNDIRTLSQGMAEMQAQLDALHQANNGQVDPAQQQPPLQQVS